MARVILAQTWFECGEYRNTLDTLQGVELNTPYSYIVQTQALAMKGNTQSNRNYFHCFS